MLLDYFFIFSSKHTLLKLKKNFNFQEHFVKIKLVKSVNLFSKTSKSNYKRLN